MNLAVALSTFHIIEKQDIYRLFPTDLKATMFILQYLYHNNYSYRIGVENEQEFFKINKLTYNFLVKQSKK